MPDAEQQANLLRVVEVEAQHLCTAVKQASEAGVPEGLLLPALIAVFREAGMIPQSLDFGSLLGRAK